MPPPVPARAALATNVNVDVLYTNLTTPPRRGDVVAILVARVQELLDPGDRNALQVVDSAWMDKASQVFDGLLQRCPPAQVATQLAAVAAAEDGLAARRIRFNFARAMPLSYGAYAYALARAMVAAAAEASQDPDMVDAVTPATVLAVAPLNNATGVPVATKVTATFSEAMDATTFDAATFLLANPAGATVPATVTYDEAGLVATLTPNGPLTAGVTYTARLRGGPAEPTIRDAQGTPLASDLTWPFTTA